MRSKENTVGGGAGAGAGGGREGGGKKRAKSLTLCAQKVSTPELEDYESWRGDVIIKQRADGMPSLSLDSGRNSKVSPVAIIDFDFEVDSDGIVHSCLPSSMPRQIEEDDIDHSYKVLVSGARKFDGSDTHLPPRVNVPGRSKLSIRSSTIDATVDCARLCGVAIAISVSASKAKLCKKECRALVATVEELYWEIDQITSTLSESVTYRAPIEQSMMESLISTVGEALVTVRRCENQGSFAGCCSLASWCFARQQLSSSQINDLRRDMVGVRARIIVSIDLCTFLRRWAEECDDTGDGTSPNGQIKLPLKGRRLSLTKILQEDDSI